jgi:hypothetical protein
LRVMLNRDNPQEGGRGTVLEETVFYLILKWKSVSKWTLYYS